MNLPDTRQANRFAFLREAYNCIPCSVRLDVLTSPQIVRLLRPNRPQRTRPKEIPAPTQEIETGTIDHQSKYTNIYVFNSN